MSASRPLRVLLAEDEPEIRQYVRDILAHREDVELLAVGSGEAGVEVLEREWVDVVVSDQRMGGMDGLAFLERAAKLAPDAPRMMITGYAELDLIEAAKNRSHVDRFVAKPFSPKVFLDAVQPLLDARRRQAMRQAAFARVLGN